MARRIATGFELRLRFPVRSIRTCADGSDGVRYLEARASAIRFFFGFVAR